jgi:hypothetical protein
VHDVACGEDTLSPVHHHYQLSGVIDATRLSNDRFGMSLDAHDLSKRTEGAFVFLAKPVAPRAVVEQVATMFDFFEKNVE